MGHDPRSNPDPSTLRGRVWFAVDGWDATDGLRMRALFSAPDLNTAVAVAQREGMVGELYRVQSGDILTWQRWADALVPHSGLLMIPTPKASFFRSEGRMLQLLLWATMALFVAIMIVTWVAAEKANPVLLDLETGKPVRQKPVL